ncbi:dipicolinate synthase subunit B [Acidaminobacterium chupaoyuni]
MTDRTIGIGICGSFCTFSQILPVIERLAKYNTVIPVLSDAAYSTDTRFYKAEDFRAEVERLCKHKIIHTIVEAEPIGPRKMFDAMVIAPCTGNTLAKLNHGITDTPVLMAAKAHIRNDRPLILAVSTNDALGAAAQNIGGLLNRRNVYFVPFSQDDHEKKPRSMVARMGLIENTIELALKGEQIEPIIL